MTLSSSNSWWNNWMSFLQLVLSLDKTKDGINSIQDNMSAWHLGNVLSSTSSTIIALRPIGISAISSTSSTMTDITTITTIWEAVRHHWICSWNWCLTANISVPDCQLLHRIKTFLSRNCYFASLLRLRGNPHRTLPRSACILLECVLV